MQLGFEGTDTFKKKWRKGKEGSSYEQDDIVGLASYFSEYVRILFCMKY